jgi:hypothetical protein
MDYHAGSNESSDYEGFRNPSSKNSTGPVVIDPRYPASHSTEINSLRPSSTISFGSRPFPSANEFNTNVSSNTNASSIGIGNYTNTPTFLEESDSDMCFESETIAPFSTATNVTDFDHLLHGWPPLANSLHATSSGHDNYSTDFAPWPASAVPWPGTSAEGSVGEVRDGFLRPS